MSASRRATRPAPRSLNGLKSGTSANGRSAHLVISAPKRSRLPGELGNMSRLSTKRGEVHNMTQFGPAICRWRLATWQCGVVIVIAHASIAIAFANLQTSPQGMSSDPPVVPPKVEVQSKLQTQSQLLPSFLTTQFKNNCPDPLEDMSTEEVAARFCVVDEQLPEFRHLIAIRRDARTDCIHSLAANPDGAKLDSLMRERQVQKDDEPDYAAVLLEMVTVSRFENEARHSFEVCDAIFARQLAILRGVREEDLQREIESVRAILRRLSFLRISTMVGLRVQPSIDLEGLVATKILHRPHSSVVLSALGDMQLAHSAVVPIEPVIEEEIKLNPEQQSAVDSAIDSWRRAFDAMIDHLRAREKSIAKEGTKVSADNAEAWIRKTKSNPKNKMILRLHVEMFGPTLATIDAVANAIGQDNPRTINFIRECHHVFAPYFTDPDTADRMLTVVTQLNGLSQHTRASIGELQRTHAREAAALERKLLDSYRFLVDQGKGNEITDPEGFVFKTNQKRINFANSTCEQILNLLENTDRQKMVAWWNHERDNPLGRWMIAP